MINKKVDKKNRYIAMFNTKTGEYVRTGVINEYGIDTNVDPFMSDFPELIDVGIMGHCVHGKTGLCIKSGVECYQNGLAIHKSNMSFNNFKKIVNECKGKTFQFALGGRGDVDQHEEFEDVLKYCSKNDIVPNFTTSGLGLTKDKIDICKKYCGAIAVSWYRQQHTINAIDSLVSAGVKTNIHYVLGNNSIDEAINRLKNDSFPKGINAIVFLLHKPVGLGSESNVLNANDDRVKEFYEFIDSKEFDFKIGFDSCNVPAILNFTKNINRDSIDTCEGGRYSCYIDAEMKMIPCSFDNQDMRWSVDLNKNSIYDAWHSNKFENFRDHFRNSCSSCKDRIHCFGGCPIKRQVVLCNRKEKDLYEN